MRSKSTFSLAAGLLTISPFILFAAPAAAASIAGVWTAQFELGDQSTDYDLDLKQEGEKVTGDMVSPRSQNHYPVSKGGFKDSTLTLDIPRNFGGQDVVLHIVAKLEKDGRLVGTVGIEGLGEGKFEAKLKSPAKPAAPPPAKRGLKGRWKTVTQIGDRELAGNLEVTEREGKLHGVSTSERGSLELKSVALGDEGKVVMTLEINGREFKILAAFDGADRLKGNWEASDDHTVSGSWNAEREAAAPAAATAAAAAKAAVEPAGPLAGRLGCTTTLPEGRRIGFQLFLKASGEKLTGHMIAHEGRRFDIQPGTFKEGNLAFEVDVTGSDGQSRHLKFTGTVGAKGNVKGSWSGGDVSGDWTGSPAVEL